MKQAYRVLALLIALGVVVQAAAIAFGWFEVLADVEDGTPFTEDSDFTTGLIIHSTVGLVIPLLALILLVLSFFTKAVGASKWAGFVLLAAVVQVALAFVSFGVAPVGLLHGANAIVLLGLALAAARRMTAADIGAHSVAAAPQQRGGVPQQSSTV